MNINDFLKSLGFTTWYPTTRYIERALELLVENESDWHLWKALEVDKSKTYCIDEWHIKCMSTSVYLRERDTNPLWTRVRSYLGSGSICSASAEDIVVAFYHCYKYLNSLKSPKWTAICTIDGGESLFEVELIASDYTEALVRPTPSYAIEIWVTRTTSLSLKSMM